MNTYRSPVWWQIGAGVAASWSQTALVVCLLQNDNKSLSYSNHLCHHRRGAPHVCLLSLVRFLHSYSIPAEWDTFFTSLARGTTSGSVSKLHLVERLCLHFVPRSVWGTKGAFSLHQTSGPPRKHRFGTIDWLQNNPGSRIRRICLEWKGASNLKSDPNCVRSTSDRTSDGSGIAHLHTQRRFEPSALPLSYTATLVGAWHTKRWQHKEVIAQFPLCLRFVVRWPISLRFR